MTGNATQLPPPPPLIPSASEGVPCLPLTVLRVHQGADSLAGPWTDVEEERTIEKVQRRSGAASRSAGCNPLRTLPFRCLPMDSDQNVAPQVWVGNEMRKFWVGVPNEFAGIAPVRWPDRIPPLISHPAPHRRAELGPC